MPDADGRISNAVLKEGIDEIKNLLLDYEQRLRSLEQSYAGSHPLMLKSLKDLEEITQKHDRDLVVLRELITTQAQSIEKLANAQKTVSRILNWMLGIFTVVATAVIIMLITGQAEIIFK